MRLTEEIPQRAFINAQIVQEAQKSGNWSDAVKSICKRYELKDYQFMNQAYVTSLLYCLLVVPKEVWIGKDRAHSVLKKINETQLREKFHIQIKKDPTFDVDFKYNLLHKLRNSVAHVNYKIDENMIFTFWNESRGNETFRCSITAENLMLFLSEVGSILANQRSENNSLLNGDVCHFAVYMCKPEQ